MSTPSPQPPLGQVIGSRYRVLSLIGRGGMGMVYSAMHELTARRVALKLMLADSEDGPVLHDRFLSEARIAAAVRHPNIVDVLDMGLHGSAPFIVMELLEGRSLEHVLQTQRQLSIEQTLSWAFPILGALSVLHEAGIVHRDIKPSNIFMSSLPRQPLRPKLLDFGLARVVSDLRLTRSGTVIGTPLYMAPEHAAGLSTGPQADVWSIGVVLYESLAGVSPFNYVDRSSLALQVLAGMVRPLAEVRPDLPAPVCNVINRALQRDLGRRYPDMRALAQALLAAAQVCGIPVPADPDPMGLPDYASWLSGARFGTTTREHVVPSASAPSSAVASLAGSSSPSVASLERAPRRVSSGWLWLVPALLLALLGVWWKRALTETGPVRSATLETPVAATPPASPVSARHQEPTVESLARPSPNPITKPLSAPPTSRRRAGAERAAQRRGAVDTAAKPIRQAIPDEVEPEWK
ncbi:MAG: Serine/threonine protein kinase PrkC, regulator of stationary phase [Myxococcaceae bacterium]|nr:Serine/threonine protein kinase PrkC, regulator of stationary phase [Myxococcaceae bacterium]